LRRLATRDVLESQLRSFDLRNHPGAVPTSFQPRLVLDTTRPLGDVVAEALTYVRLGAPA